MNERFWSKVEKTDTCWNWIAGKTSDGYGRFKINGKTQRAHRVLYESIKGKISNELVIDHLCRNTSCVNPNHMELVTVKENLMRGIGICSLNAKKTHCKRGHEFNEKNIYRYKNYRICKICRDIIEKNRPKRIRRKS